jgi:hypothetical protein
MEESSYQERAPAAGSAPAGGEVPRGIFARREPRDLGKPEIASRLFSMKSGLVQTRPSQGFPACKEIEAKDRVASGPLRVRACALRSYGKRLSHGLKRISTDTLAVIALSSMILLCAACLYAMLTSLMRSSQGASSERSAPVASPSHLEKRELSLHRPQGDDESMSYRQCSFNGSEGDLQSMNAGWSAGSDRGEMNGITMAQEKPMDRHLRALERYDLSFTAEERRLFFGGGHRAPTAPAGTPSGTPAPLPSGSERGADRKDIPSAGEESIKSGTIMASPQSLAVVEERGASPSPPALPSAKSTPPGGALPPASPAVPSGAHDEPRTCTISFKAFEFAGVNTNGYRANCMIESIRLESVDGPGYSDTRYFPPSPDSYEVANFRDVPVPTHRPSYEYQYAIKYLVQYKGGSERYFTKTGRIRTFQRDRGLWKSEADLMKSWEVPSP